MVFLNKFNQIMHGITSVLLAIMTILVIVQVFTRFFPDITLPFTEELARFTMIWAVMIGATVLIKKQTHIAVTFIFKKFPPKMKKVVNIFNHLLVLTFCLVIFVIGYRLIISGMAQVAPATQINMGLVILCIPIFGVIGVIYTIEHIFKEIQTKDEAKG